MELYQRVPAGNPLLLAHRGSHILRRVLLLPALLKVLLNIGFPVHLLLFVIKKLLLSGPHSVKHVGQQ